MFSLTFLLILLTAVLGSSLMVALIAYVHHRLGKLESGAQGNDRVLSELENLRDQLDSTTQTLASLEARMDFTERLLTDGAEGKNDDE